jgi:nitric oxide dioxygenase
MSLTQSDVTVIRDSFALVARDAPGATACFYGHLFALAPDLRPLFPADMTAQGEKLATALSVVARLAGDFETLAPILDVLAVRHVAYGARPEHYPVVGAALLQMLDERVPMPRPDSLLDAWGKAFAAISARMIAAAEAAGDRPAMSARHAVGR